MIWSSFSEGGYVEAVAEAENGNLYGNWLHSETLLSASNGGHGMLFHDLNQRLQFVMHTPNDPFHERPAFFEIEEKGNKLTFKDVHF